MHATVAVAREVRRLVGRLVGRLVDRLVGRSVGLLIGWFLDWLSVRLLSVFKFLSLTDSVFKTLALLFYSLHAYIFSVSNISRVRRKIVSYHTCKVSYAYDGIPIFYLYSILYRT